MPTYTLQCRSDKCLKKFERTQKMSAPNPICPTCGEQTKKLLVPTPFILKGNGWFKDGYS